MHFSLNHFDYYLLGDGQRAYEPSTDVLSRIHERHVGMRPSIRHGKEHSPMVSEKGMDDRIVQRCETIVRRKEPVNFERCAYCTSG